MSNLPRVRCAWGLLGSLVLLPAASAANTEAGADPNRGQAAVATADFAIVVLPDTQFYSCQCKGGDPATFKAQTQWIADNAVRMNVAFVAHVGDIVQYGDQNVQEWRNAVAALEILDSPKATHRPEGIPRGLAVGDHDQDPHGDAKGATRYYNEFFGPQRFAGRTWYGGHHGDSNDNHYVLFSAGGMDFIAICLEQDQNADRAVLQWADGVLKEHAARRAIVISHHLLGADGKLSKQGRVTYDALKRHPNLFLMLCGHVSAEKHRIDIHEGRAVHTLLADFQRRPNGGDAWLRLLRFSPAANRIHVRTWSPTLDRFETDRDSDFTIFYNMRSMPNLAADLDADGDVDRQDVALFQVCFARPTDDTQNGCARADLDASGEIDQRDVMVFMECIRAEDAPEEDSREN